MSVQPGGPVGEDAPGTPAEPWYAALQQPDGPVCLPLPPGTTVLQRYSIKPRHLDPWFATWPDELALRRRLGYQVHRAFLETHAEPKLTWLYSHDDLPTAEAALAREPEWAEICARRAGHVFRNVVTRPVLPEVITAPSGADRLVVMRRYSIVGSWEEFRAIWRRIAPVRAHYGFRCLFAVADEPGDMFTWAFDFDGQWDDFPAAQRPYYHDPDRVALRQVFDYMADYAIAPARELPLE